MNVGNQVIVEISKTNTCTLVAVGDENTYMHTKYCGKTGDRTFFQEDTKSFSKFVMRGPSGVHTLEVSCTDKARLKAHWENFCAYNKEVAPKFKLRAADFKSKKTSKRFS